MESKWLKFLSEVLPYVVLNNVLYQTDVGRVSFCFLDSEGTTHTNTATRRIGTVPIKHRDRLTKRGFKLRAIGFFPMGG